MRRARRLSLPALPLLALLFLACTDANGPTTSINGSPSFGIANQSLTKEEQRQRHEELKARLEAEKRRIHDLKEARKSEFELARAQWKAYRQALKLLHKNKAAATFDLFRCEPRPYEGDAEIIGPGGGTLHVGEHELVVPKGALAEEQLIVAEAPTSSLVDVEFSPEGLTFAIPARLTLSYKGCEVPLGLDLLLAYVGWGNRILELPPSKDLKDLDEVVGEIEHFSRYAVAY